MPITIKTDEIKVRKESGGYKSINAVSESTTDEQINAINEAGTSNVTKINTKAAEVTSQLANAGELEDMIADAFDPNTNYSAGNYVIQTDNDVNKLYKFTADHEAGDWTGADVVETKIGTEVNDLKNAFEFETDTKLAVWNEDRYYKLSSSVTNIDVNTTDSLSGWGCTYFECTEGDIFYYTGYGNTAARNWAFLKANGDIISRATAGTYEHEQIVAPPLSAYAVFNINLGLPHEVIYGEILPQKVNSLTQAVSSNTDDIERIDNSLSTLFDAKSVTKTGEVLDIFSIVDSVSISGASSVAVRNSQIFEAKYPGTSGQFGVAVTRNDDDTYTFNGLATSGAYFHLNQSTRTGTDNPIEFNGTYTISAEIVSGSWEKVSYEGDTPGFTAIRDKTTDTDVCNLVIGNKTQDTIDVSVQNAVIAFRVTTGVRYNNLRIAISVNKGTELLPRVKYVTPETYTSFDDLTNAVQRCAPNVWIIASPSTATISISGQTPKNSDSPGGGGQDINLYGILEKYNDRVDTLAQMFNRPLFLIYTDIHGNADNLSRINTWYNANKPVYVSDIFCLGDMVQDQATDSISGLANVPLWGSSLKIIGNHDVLVSGTIPGITAVECYNKYISPDVANWDVVQPENAATDGKSYYYKDYSNKVRVIVLDTYFYTTAQHTWFEATLADALTNSLAVIVMQHEDICTASEKHPLNTEYPFAKKHDGYTGLQYRTYGDGGNYQTKRAAVDTFIGNGGTFICWLSGHTHADMTGTYDGGINGKQLSVVLANASNSMTAYMRINNYSQDCLTYMGVDTTEHYLYLLRVGESVDKWFHQNLFLCYDYVNHVVVEYH